MNRILLIRHGNTDMLGRSLSGRMPGIFLNSSGRQQAAELGEFMGRGQRLTSVISSPLERATETAEAVAAPQGLTLRTDERLQEIDFGAWTGKSFDELSHLDEWRTYNLNRSLYHAPGGESFCSVQARVAEFFLQAARLEPCGTVAVVTHADVIRCLLVLCLGMPIELLLRLTIATASVSEISLEGQTPVVHRVNWTVHPAV